LKSALPDERELAILTAGRETAGREAEAPYEWAAHEPISRREGTRPKTLVRVRDGAPTDGLTPRETIIIDTVRALYRTRTLSQAQFDRAAAEFGWPGLVEVVAVAGFRLLPERVPGRHAGRRRSGDIVPRRRSTAWSGDAVALLPVLLPPSDRERGLTSLRQHDWPARIQVGPLGAGAHEPSRPGQQ
jgi:hypothetical protein